jgi:hypothetical protein
MEDWKDAGDVEEFMVFNSSSKIICHPRQIQQLDL